MPKRWFNTAGPCKPEVHYMVPSERRVPRVRDLVDQMGYFVVHAPRQVGKTTSLMSLADTLTSEGHYCAVLLSMEVGQPFGDDPGAAEAAILAAWRNQATSRLPADLQPPPWPQAPEGQRIGTALAAWSRSSARPLVVFLDEIDALHDQALMTVLRQLRSSYPDRPRDFPWSLALVGLRDVRDYKVASGGNPRLGTASPFNIKAESLTLSGFTSEEVAELYAQHTQDTGQAFAPQAVARAFELTQGQPWLVNALARQCVEVLLPDRSQRVQAAHVERAKELLIERQDTHLDSLSERLREDRVRRVMEPLLAGTSPGQLPPDDVRYVEDLGLARRTNGSLQLANPIYAEVIPTALADVARAFMPAMQPTWLRPDGSLDAHALLEAFLAFWREHGEPLMQTTPYHEIAPHLVLMAFLHRVVNGGGSLAREVAVGSGRMDLLLSWKDQRLAMELKVWRPGKPDPQSEGLQQLDRYLEGLGLLTGWLIIFDRRPESPPVEQRTVATTADSPGGHHVTIIRA